jgi:periplasmic divalent cation tolerance protein
MSSRCLQVFVTYPDRRSAERAVLGLVEKKLAACGQIAGPVRSVYRWKGRIERSAEYLCLFKTTTARYKKFEQAVKAGHPYEVPEIAAVPIVKGSTDYLKWLKKGVGGR